MFAKRNETIITGRRVNSLLILTSGIGNENREYGMEYWRSIVHCLVLPHDDVFVSRGSLFHLLATPSSKREIELQKK